MLGVLKNIFSGGEVVKEGFALIDSFHTSDEERIEAKSKALTNRLNAYAPFKLAQRLLALMFASTFLLCFFIVLICTLAGVGNPSDVLDVMRVFYIGEIMLAIIGFYFCGGMVEGGIAAYRGSVLEKPQKNT